MLAYTFVSEMSVSYSQTWQMYAAIGAAVSHAYGIIVWYEVTGSL